MTKKPGFFKRLKALDPLQKQLFATALCQRMYPNYQLFSEVCEFGDSKVLSTVLELLWQSIYDKKMKFNYEIHLERLDAVTPDPEDFVVYGAYPAMDAAVALTSLVGAIQGKQEDDMVNISKLSSATVANYIEATIETDLDGDALDDFIFDQEVMQEERELQASLLDIIEENPINAELVKELRKEIIASGVSNIGVSAD